MSTIKTVSRAALAAALVVLSGSALAESMKGRIDAVDSGAKTIQLNGITFQTTGSTAYAGVSGFAALKQGDRVKVEFSRDGSRYVAVSIVQE